MKKILMIGTGGTIASAATPDGLEPQISSAEILHYIPGISKLCKIDTLEVCNIDSTNISPPIWTLLTETIREHYESYDGFVITHGTDTMAYTAAALSYMIQHSPKPIVITGSQKPINMEISDSKTNLYDSFLYASSDKASGVQIVFNGKVILGTRGRKTHSKSYNAFSSINYPYIAVIQDNHLISFIEQPKAEQPAFYPMMNPKVGLFKLTPGVEADILDYMFSKKDAVVIESYGVGGIPSLPEYGFNDTIQKWTKKGKIIVMTTQVPNEGSDIEVYKVGHSLKSQLNVLEAYDMTTEAVVTKLMWVLGRESNPEKIKQLFYQTIANDILY